MAIEWKVLDTEEAWANAAADIVCGVLAENKAPKLVLPTGGTPVPMYAELVRRFNAGTVSFAHAESYNLDEYVGLPLEHPESYYSFMHRNLFDKVDFPAGKNHLPDGLNADPEAACADYNAILDASGGIDLAILGIGHNGHIGFNEPGADPEGRTHCEGLSLSTRQANARFFDDDIEKVPSQALTMGLGDIMAAKTILLLATGEGKAEILKKGLQGEVTTQVPCSILQKHPHVIVLMDTAAASKLDL